MPLESWEDIQTNAPFHHLLLGNGASCAVSRCFCYDTLYDVALTNGMFTPQGLRLFEELRTTNFEMALGHLSKARLVLQCLGQGTQEVDACYTAVGRTLARAVAATHVPWVDCEGVLEAYQAVLGSYTRVFTTNYDLLPYWACMYGGNRFGFRDLFFNGTDFDPSNTDIRDGAPGMFFLHGALHLRQTARGSTVKRMQAGATLLTQFEQDEVAHPTDVPLIITGGDADDKLRGILASSYLHHCYRRLGRLRGSLCVFGHSFADCDKHITDCFKDNTELRTIAVSVYAQNRSNVAIEAEKARLMERLHADGRRVCFFDSATHPLARAVTRQLG